MKLALKITSLVAFFTISSLIGIAQPPPGPCEDPSGECDPAGAPFDGGVSLVIAAGAGIGAYKLRKKNKDQN